MNMQALDDYLLDAYDEPQEQEEREQFRIENDDMANWAIRKIAKARKEFAEAEQQAERETERIDAWLDGKRKAKERDEEFFTGLLTAYYLPQHMEDPQRKTFKLPAGAFQVRQQQPEFQRDDVELVKWLESHVMPDYLEVVKKPKWGELKKLIETKGGVATVAGEVVGGIMVVPRGLKFTVATEEV
jgi:hypothetical protein